MALPIPTIDDKKFDKLAEEARILIPRYAREWTDHNVTDPGITFLELFAWLAEMQLYQMDQLTDDIRREFLKLVDIEPLYPKTARTSIHFDSILPNATGLIEAGTAIIPVGKESLHFQAAEDFFLTRSKLTSITSQYDSKTVDYSQLNAAGDAYFLPFGPHMPKNATLQLGFDSWFKEKEIQLTVLLAEENGGVTADVLTEGLPDWTSVQLAWEYYSQDGWREIEDIKDTTANLARSGRVVFQRPKMAHKKDNFYWLRCQLVRGKYEIIPRIHRILLNCIPTVQIETIIRENVGQGSGLPGQQVELKKAPVFVRRDSEPLRFYIGDIANWADFIERLQTGQKDPIKYIRSRLEPLGWTGPPDQPEPSDNQKYDLVAALNKLVASADLYEKKTSAFEGYDFTEPYKALIDSLATCISDRNLKKLNRYLIQQAFPDLISQPKMLVQVQDQAACIWNEWREVVDFDESSPDDPHYVFDPLDGIITFGNGLNGCIPDTPENIRVCFYYRTSGAAGNLPAGQQWLIKKTNFSGMFGTNLRPAAGGTDAEPLDEAEIRARKDFRTVHRAVTLADYERLAMSVPGLPVARAKAIANFDPDYPCLSIPGKVTVVIVPKFRKDRAFVESGIRFIQAVQDYLDQRRLITTAVRVIGPDYVKITVKCTVFVKHKSSPAKVIERIDHALKMFLYPLDHKPDETDTESVINGWPFGRPVYPSEIYELIDKVEGVDYLVDVKLEAQGTYQKRNGVIEIPRYGLVYSGKHEIKTQPALNGS